MTQVLGVVCILAAFFVLGTWYGLYLNVTHMYRMQRWANRVAAAVETANDREFSMRQGKEA